MDNPSGSPCSAPHCTAPPDGPCPCGSGADLGGCCGPVLDSLPSGAPGDGLRCWAARLVWWYPRALASLSGIEPARLLLDLGRAGRQLLPSPIAVEPDGDVVAECPSGGTRPELRPLCSRPHHALRAGIRSTAANLSPYRARYMAGLVGRTSHGGRVCPWIRLARARLAAVGRPLGGRQARHGLASQRTHRGPCVPLDRPDARQPAPRPAAFAPGVLRGRRVRWWYRSSRAAAPSARPGRAPPTMMVDRAARAGIGISGRSCGSYRPRCCCACSLEVRPEDAGGSGHGPVARDSPRIRGPTDGAWMAIASRLQWADR